MSSAVQEGLLLLVHGEVTDPAVDFFDREKVFIETKLKPLLERLPELRVVLEHITTRDAAEFVAAGPASLAASVTPQHLLLNRNALFLVPPPFRGAVWHDVRGWRLHALPCLATIASSAVTPLPVAPALPSILGQAAGLPHGRA